LCERPDNAETPGQAARVAALGLDDDHSLHSLELHQSEVPEELLSNEEHLRPRVIEDVFHLRCRESPVHRERHGIDHPGSEEEREVFRHVTVEESDPLFRGHRFREQRLRDARRFLLKLAVCPGPLAGSQGNLVRTFLRVDAQVFVLGLKGHFWFSPPIPTKLT
jgi:hypothetical protein